MKTVGQYLPNFEITAVGADNSIWKVNQNTFKGRWKVIVFYPKDFTFVCPTEIVGYDALLPEFQSRNAELLIGSVDNEFVKIAWKEADPQLSKVKSIMFADQRRGEWDPDTDIFTGGLAEQLGVLLPEGVALRATFIVDENNMIQHVTVNNLNVGRNPEETLRVLDALQTGEKTACARPLGGATL